MAAVRSSLIRFYHILPDNTIGIAGEYQTLYDCVRQEGYPVTDDQWLTVDVVAKRLGMHPDTVRRLLREGRLVGHRINRRAGWRVRASEVDRFIEEGDAPKDDDK